MMKKLKLNLKKFPKKKLPKKKRDPRPKMKLKDHPSNSSSRMTTWVTSIV